MPAPHNNRTLSIMVVAFNERDHIPRLKTAIDQLQVEDGIHIETILVDGGSTDGTVEAARTAGFTKIIEAPDQNIPVCRNLGLQQASGAWLAFLDADTEPAPDWFMRALPFLKKEEAVIIGWPVEPPHPGTWVQRAWHVHWTHKNPAYETWEGHPVVKTDAFRLIATRNLLMNRAAREAVGDFDEKLPTGEDTDYVFRAYMKKLTVLGVPALQVVHHGEPETLAAFYRQQTWHANRSSYSKIMATSGGKTGGNAPKFTVLFMICFLLSLAGLLTSLLLREPAYLFLVLPLFGLVAAPAAWISCKARKPGQFFPLCVLYAAYGLARGLDLTGFYRKKKSWKSG